VCAAAGGGAAQAQHSRGGGPVRACTRTWLHQAGERARAADAPPQRAAAPRRAPSTWPHHDAGRPHVRLEPVAAPQLLWRHVHGRASHLRAQQPAARARRAPHTGSRLDAMRTHVRARVCCAALATPPAPSCAASRCVAAARRRPAPPTHPCVWQALLANLLAAAKVHGHHLQGALGFGGVHEVADAGVQRPAQDDTHTHRQTHTARHTQTGDTCGSSTPQKRVGGSRRVRAV
jgi:hypothetical protein